MDHKFTIRGVRQVEAHFVLNPEFKKNKDKPVEIMHQIAIKHDMRDNDIHVLISFSSDAEKQPFRFAVAWQGVFSFEKAPPKDIVERIAHINCASILFPYIRESVADLTRRAGIPPLHIDPVNFIALYEERQSQSKPAAVKRKARKQQKRRG